MSCRLSPLDTDEPFAEKVMTSADSRFAAASKEIRVRVESSKKRLTTVRPRSTGSFFTSWVETRLISSAVSSRSIASVRERSAVESRCFIVTPPVRIRPLRRPDPGR